MRVFGVFRVKPEERMQAAVALMVIVALNALFIWRLHELFLQPGFGPYWKAFEHELHLSGYDPYTYLTVTDWDVVYEPHRHPLLAFLIWPLWLLNQGLTWLTGVNCVQYVVALPVIFCSFYSYIFLYRIHREVVGLHRDDATLLTICGFAMAYLLLSVIVPDHFTVSMFLLLLMLYLSGICIRRRRELRWWQSALLFILTAGITLSNGVKVFLATLFVSLKPRLLPLAKAFIVPAALLWGVAVWQHHAFVEPREQAREAVKQRKAEAVKAQVARMTPTSGRTSRRSRRAARQCCAARPPRRASPWTITAISAGQTSPPRAGRRSTRTSLARPCSSIVSTSSRTPSWGALCLCLISLCSATSSRHWWWCSLC